MNGLFLRTFQTDQLLIYSMEYLYVGSLDYKNPLHLNVEDRYLRRMGDPDEDPPSLESFYSPIRRRYRTTTVNVLWILCLIHRRKAQFNRKTPR